MLGGRLSLRPREPRDARAGPPERPWPPPTPAAAPRNALSPPPRPRAFCHAILALQKGLRLALGGAWRGNGGRADCLHFLAPRRGLPSWALLSIWLGNRRTVYRQNPCTFSNRLLALAVETLCWGIPGHNASSWVKDWAPLMAASITGFVTLATAFVIATIAHRQAETAANKLSLDLFEHRFASWKKLEAAFSSYMDELKHRYVMQSHLGIPIEITHDWVEAEADAHWLFGPEVFGQIRLTGDLVEKMFDNIPDDDEGEPDEREARFERNAIPAYRAFAKLREKAGPYMMLNKIAVNQPRTRRRMFRSKDRAS